MTFFTNIPILDGPFWCLENLAGSYQFNYTCAKQGTESAEMRLPVVEPRSQTFPRFNWNGSLGITDELSQCKENCSCQSRQADQLNFDDNRFC